MSVPFFQFSENLKVEVFAGKEMKLDRFKMKLPEVIPTPQAVAGWVEDALVTSTRSPRSPFGNFFWAHFDIL